jgi:prepilin-type N-terminal cleavage/methylation domain-containing protein
MKSDRQAGHRQAGFTLVELMVSLVLSLLVAAAVVALVVAVVRSNRQTLQSTRLNQELRATLNLVANDLRRARSVEDPLTNYITPVAITDVRTPGGTCAIYGYVVDGATQWHVLRVDNAGHLVLHDVATRPADCNPGGSPAQLGSDQIRITNLQFIRLPVGVADDFVRHIDVEVTGRLVDTNPNAPIVERTMRQTVYVRSVGTGI